MSAWQTSKGTGRSMNQKQRAASVRNWRRLQLKGALALFSQLRLDPQLLSQLEQQAEARIAEQWAARKKELKDLGIEL